MSSETTEDLVEQYLTAVDEMDGLDESDPDFDSWAIDAANAADALKGRIVSAAGVTGTVKDIIGDKVYLETPAGLVEGDSRTIEALETSS